MTSESTAAQAAVVCGSCDAIGRLRHLTVRNVGSSERAEEGGKSRKMVSTLQQQHRQCFREMCHSRVEDLYSLETAPLDKGDVGSLRRTGESLFDDWALICAKESRKPFSGATIWCKECLSDVEEETECAQDATREARTWIWLCVFVFVTVLLALW
jgi:hypothetical protein